MSMYTRMCERRRENQHGGGVRDWRGKVGIKVSGCSAIDEEDGKSTKENEMNKTKIKEKKYIFFRGV